MRGLSKPWPPANVSPEGQDACSFVEAERQYLAALPAAQDRTACARAHFDQLDKKKLRAVMYGEQGSICAYCERRLSEQHPFPRIDHWRPLSIDHDVALHWNNLYLSCPTHGTCDDAKGNQRLRGADGDPDLRWPTDLRLEDLVGFTSRGELYVRDDAVMDDATRRSLQAAIDQILALNQSALVAARAAWIDREKTRLERRFQDRHASRQERDQMADDRLASEPLPEFVSIRVAYLRKTLGRGR